jgi:curli production assembly/transport component CsgF
MKIYKAKEFTNYLKTWHFVLILLFTSNIIPLGAQDFVYTPVNPAFGGNTFNYQWMLSSAQAQNTITEDVEDFDPFAEQDPLEDFEESLNRQILSQLTRELVYNQFGEIGLTEGYYELGSYQIEVAPGETGIEINIFDISTGSETKVTVPYF